MTLIKVQPGDYYWGFKESLESVFHKTQELVGQEVQLRATNQSSVILEL